MPFQDLSVGATAAPSYPVYDDAILRIARNTTSAKAARNTAAQAARPTLTFGGNIPTMGTGTGSGQTLSYGSNVPRMADAFSIFNLKADDFSLGTPVARSPTDFQYAPQAPVARSPTDFQYQSPVQPIPSVTTVDGDGSTGSIGGFGSLSDLIAGAMGGGTDDAQYTQVAQTSQIGGMNPVWIAAAALGAAVIYYSVTK